MTLNMMKNLRTSRHGVKSLAVVAALGLALTGCGSQDESAPQQEQPPAESSAPAENEQTSDPAAAPTTESPTTDSATSPAAGGDLPESADAVNSAIDTAVAQLSGSKAFDYEYDNQQFEIEVTDGQQEQEVVVASDGTTVTDTQTDGVDRDDRQELMGAQVDMKQAIQVALNQQAGVAVSAELDRDRNLSGDAPDTLAWDIEIEAQDGTEADVVVDAQSAQVLSFEIDR